MVAIKIENGQKKRCTGLQTTLLVSESDWSLLDRVIISLGWLLVSPGLPDKKINAVEWVLSKFYPKRAIFDGKGAFFV